MKSRIKWVLALLFTFICSAPKGISAFVYSGNSSFELTKQLKFYSEHGSSHHLPQENIADFLANFKSVESLDFPGGENFTWAFLEFSYTGEESRNLVLYLRQTLIDQVDFFHLNGTKWDHYQSGDRIAFSSRSLPSRFPNIRFVPKPGQNVLFIRVKCVAPYRFNLLLTPETQFLNFMTNDQSFHAFYFGIMFAVLAYNLFVFISTRKVNYLTYGAVVLAIAFNQFCVNGFIGMYFFPEGQPKSTDYITAATSPLACVTALLFTAEFLELRNRDVRAYRATILCILFCCVITISLFFSSLRYALNMIALAIVPSIILMIYVGLKGTALRFRPAYFYIASWMLLFVGSLINMFRNLSIIPDNLLTMYAHQIGSTFEVVLLSFGLADRIKILQRELLNSQAEKIKEEEKYKINLEKINDMLSAANGALTQYIEHVENIIQEKTRHIRSMLDTLRMGIATVSKSLKIEPDYSAHLGVLLNKGEILHRDLIEFLYDGSSVNEDLKSIVRSVLSSCIGESRLQWEMNAHLLPREWRMFSAGRPQILECEYSPILHNDLVERVLIALRDVTDLRHLEQISREQAIEREIIVQLIGIEPEKFGIFMRAARPIFDIKEKLRHASNHSDIKMWAKGVLANLHTLKGNARSLGLSHLSEIVHHAEQLLEDSRTKHLSWNSELVLERILRVESELDRVENLYSNVLQRTLEPRVILSLVHAKGLLEVLNDNDWQIINTSKALHACLYVLERSVWRDAHIFLREITEHGSGLAIQLGKKPPLIEIQGVSVGLGTHAMSLFYNVITHLLRNAIDHGLEAAEERLLKGKLPNGTICISLALRDQMLELIFSDDGRGLDLDKIREIATSRGLLKDAHAYPEEVIAACILYPGFSTRTEITEVSGRGVGMDAVMREITEHGGKLELALENKSEKSSRAVRFVMRLPIYHFRYFRCESRTPDKLL